jgi:malonyl-CoA/methylmalonyl-CoA synthetase
VRPGATVALWTEPGLGTLVAAIALVERGYVLLPLDPKLGARELEHIARDAQPEIALAITPSAHTGKLGAVVTLDAAPTPLSPSSDRVRPVSAADPALLLYTSGTTGLPKGVLLSSAALAHGLDALAEAWDWTERDTIVHALPVFHVHGLVLGLFGAIRRGGRLRWVPRFAPDALAQALAEAAEHDDAVLFAVPTMYHRLAEAAEHDDAVRAALAGARLLVSGSAALPAREHARIEVLTGQRIVERYGMTETLITCAMRAREERTAGLVGAPIAGLEARLRTEEGEIVPLPDSAGAIGELEVRGPTLLLGYLHQPEATRAVLSAEGWFATGDLASFEAGRVRIVGRKATDLIKCGGYRIGAGEVEGALLEHPAVAEAAVVGAPDPDLGERIVAFVVLRAEVDAKALEDHVARLLSPHKRPRELRRVSALPRNAMGKVQKQGLRALLDDPAADGQASDDPRA